MHVRYFTLFLVLLIRFFLSTSNHIQGQNTDRVLRISKISCPEKVRQIAEGSRLTIMKYSGEKIKSKNFKIGDIYLATEKYDTIYFREIYSIRAQRKLNKAESIAGIPLLIIGTTAAIAGIPISLMLIYTINAGAVTFLIPIGGVLATITGVKLVGRKTYHTDKWRIFSTVKYN